MSSCIVSIWGRSFHGQHMKLIMKKRDILSIPEVGSDSFPCLSTHAGRDNSAHN